MQDENRMMPDAANSANCKQMLQLAPQYGRLARS